jgi:Ca-activated chloride channel family protein
VDVHLINVAFSVREGRGNLVPNLGRDDFEISEDGVAQNISFFARSSDVPLTLGLLVDFSTSQEHFIKPHHQDFEKFLKTSLKAGDRAFLVGFAKDSHLLSDYTSSAKDLRQALESYQRPKDRGAFPLFGPRELRTDCGNTSFFDAVYDSITQKLGRAEKGRRAAIIFSDGDDISSAHTETDVIEASQSNDVVLFRSAIRRLRRGGSPPETRTASA